MKWVCYDGRNHVCYRAGKVLLIIGPVGIQCSCRNRRILLQKGNETQIVQMRKDLEDLTSSLGMKVTDRKVNLTPREIEVCNLVKNGLSSKEIARMLKIALHTVEKHRRTARKKLGLTSKGINLQSHLS